MFGLCGFSLPSTDERSELETCCLWAFGFPVSVVSHWWVGSSGHRAALHKTALTVILQAYNTWQTEILQGWGLQG